MGLALILGAGVAAGQAYSGDQGREARRRTTADRHRAAAAGQTADPAGSEAEATGRRSAASASATCAVEAEAARKQAEKVTDFLVEAFRSPDPERDGRTITVAEMLGKAKTSVETEFKADPLLQAKLLGAIERTYLGLGLVQEALELSQKSYDMLRMLLARSTLTRSLRCRTWQMRIIGGWSMG